MTTNFNDAQRLADLIETTVDVPQLQEQAHAWEQVYTALVKVAPSETIECSTGMQQALSIIAALHARSEELNSCEGAEYPLWRYVDRQPTAIRRSVETVTFDNGEVFQSVKDLPKIAANISYSVNKTKTSEFIAAMVALGWTPPVPDLESLRDACKDAPAPTAQPLGEIDNMKKLLALSDFDEAKVGPSETLAEMNKIAGMSAQPRNTLASNADILKMARTIVEPAQAIAFDKQMATYYCAYCETAPYTGGDIALMTHKPDCVVALAQQIIETNKGN